MQGEIARLTQELQTLGQALRRARDEGGGAPASLAADLERPFVAKAAELAVLMLPPAGRPTPGTRPAAG